MIQNPEDFLKDMLEILKDEEAKLAVMDAAINPTGDNQKRAVQAVKDYLIRRGQRDNSPNPV